MAARKSLTPFYIALAVIAVGGGALIASGAFRAAPAPLTLDTIGQLATGPRGVLIGSDSAKVEVWEFSDFECPFCARFAILTMPDIQARLVQAGRVRWRFVHYPLQGHTKSPTAHLAAACAHEQGRFWPVHDALYTSQDTWTSARNLVRAVTAAAERGGVDRERFDACMSARGAAWGHVLADKALGDSVGIGGTPTFFVNGRQVTELLTYDRLRAIVDSIEAVRPAEAAPARR
jgi:protein-disulfide isomerase